MNSTVRDINNVDGLHNLITKEQFINSCHKELTTVLKIADQYQQAHGGNLSTIGKPRSHQQEQEKDGERRICGKCGKEGHIVSRCWSNQPSETTEKKNASNQRPKTRVCHKYGVKGHIAPNC